MSGGGARRLSNSTLERRAGHGQDKYFALLTLAELSDFMALLNDIDPNLKFTIECDTKHIYYLDMWIEKSNRTLFTTPCRKETNINNILKGGSFHPEP